MPFFDTALLDRSKEWAYWRKYYADKGLSYNKIHKLVCRKMSR